MNITVTKKSFGFKAIVLTIVCLFFLNTVAWAYPDGMQLAVQSIFNQMGVGEFSEIAAVEYYLQCLSSAMAHMHGDIHLDRTINGDKVSITLGFSAKNSEEFSPLCRTLKVSHIIPCEINGKRFYALIKLPVSEGDICGITVHTEEEFEKLKEEKRDADIHPGKRKPGLIGKYVPVTDIEFIETNTETHSGILKFKAYYMEDVKEKVEVIELSARRALPGTFEKYRNTDNPEADRILDETISEIPQNSRFILEPNSYGIDGIGTKNILAIVEPFRDDDIALFHEVAQASIDREIQENEGGRSVLLGHITEELVYKREIGEAALDKYLKEKADEHGVARAGWEEYWSPHYALRLFQKKEWFLEDFRLTEKIRILRYVFRELDEVRRGYILDERDGLRRFGLFVKNFRALEEERKVDVNNSGQRKKLLAACYEKTWEEINERDSHERIFPDDALSGLIGKYMPISDIQFIPTEITMQKGHITFWARRIDDPYGRDEKIFIKAQRAPPGTFEAYRTTGIPEIDSALQDTLSIIPEENRLILEPNKYGIGGIGTHMYRGSPHMLAVASPFMNNEIALFHEVAHAAIDKERKEGKSELIETIISRLEHGQGVEEYLEAKVQKYELPEHVTQEEWKDLWRQHYALRLFQRQKWPEEDQALTTEIKIWNKIKTELDEKERKIFSWAVSELDEKKRAKILSEKWIDERISIYFEAFNTLEERLHIDIAKAPQRKRLLNVCYQIISRKPFISWKAAKKVMEYLEKDMGLDFEKIKWGTKSKLMTIIYDVGRGREGLFEFWKGFLGRIQGRFSVTSYKEIDDVERQKIATAAFYIARGGEEKERRFDSAIEIIQNKFGIEERELGKDESEGGMELTSKIRLITAAYAVALAKDGLTVFEKAIKMIGDKFGISEEKMKGSGEEDLALDEKIFLITVAYEVAKTKDGLTVFENAIDMIGDKFSISEAQMKGQAEKGLTLAQKFSIIRAGYYIVIHGLKAFEQEITDDVKSRIPGMDLSDRVTLIVAIASRVVDQSISSIEIPSGLIGKYVPVTDIKFIETNEETRKGYIRFKAYHIDDLEKKEVEITINAQRGPPGLFENYRTTGIPEIDSKLQDTLSTIPQNNRFILAPNEYGIDGIGTQDMLAIARPFINNDIALFHEVAHAAIDKEREQGKTDLLDDIIIRLEHGAALEQYLDSKAEKYSIPDAEKDAWKEAWRQHYALRLFQRQEWKEEDSALTKEIKILNWITTELDEKKRALILDEERIFERFDLFVEAFNRLEVDLYIDITVSKQRKRLLNVCYEITRRKGARAWEIDQEVLCYFQKEMRFDFTEMKWNTKSKLMTIIYGTGQGREGTFDFWKGFMGRLQEKFGTGPFEKMNVVTRQRIATAAHYIATVKDKEAAEGRFNETIDIIRENFGITEDEMRRTESEGGLGLPEKAKLISAAYHVAKSEDGPKRFEKAIKEIGNVFGITPEEMRKSKEDDGLALPDKFHLVTGAYEVVFRKGGLNTFGEVIGKIQEIFGITPEEMKEKKEDGGLALSDKFHLMTAAYGVALSNRVEVFEKTILRAGKIFGISPGEMKGKTKDSLALSDKMHLISTAYHVSMARNGLKKFEDALKKIRTTFGVTVKEVRMKKKEGGLALSDKIRFMTAAYGITQARNGLEVFEETIAKIGKIFGITPDEMKKKKKYGGLSLSDKFCLITAGYEVALKDGLKAFEETITKISDIFGISKQDMMKKEEHGGLALSDKMQLIKAGYQVVTNDGLKVFETAIRKIGKIFGISLAMMNKKEADGGLALSDKMSLIIAGYAVAMARGGTDAFVEVITKIKDIFGITTDELKKNKKNGGLAFSDKLRIIRTAYNVAKIKNGLEIFEKVVTKIGDSFGISADKIQGKEEEGGLALSYKLRLMTAAYHVTNSRGKLETLEEVINAVGDIFGIDSEKMKMDEEEGGLALKDKFSVITTVYCLTAREGLQVFKDTLDSVENIFGITRDEMKKSEEEDGLSISNKISLMTAGYEVALKDNLEGFKSTIEKIKEVLEITADELKEKGKEGSLAISDKLQLIAVVYSVADFEDRLEIFERELSKIIPGEIKTMSLSQKIKQVLEIAAQIVHVSMFPADVPAGLIGKYMPVTDIEFIETDTRTHKGIIRFKACHIEDPAKKEIEITINAERAPPGTFEECRTDNPDIDATLENIVAGVDENNRFVLEPNQYGINGIGTHQILAIVRPLSNDRIALFHEVMHVLIDKEIRRSKDGKSLLLEQITGMIIHADRADLVRTGSDALDKYLTRMTYKYKVPPEEREKWKQYWRAHYGLRLFQKTIAPEEDSALTRKIRIIDYILAELDEKARSYIFDGKEVHERFGLFVELFNTLASMAGIDLGNYYQSRNLPHVKELLSICYGQVTARTGGAEAPAEPVTKAAQESIGQDEPDVIMLTESETARKAEILRYIETELDKRQDEKRAIKRLNLFVRVFLTLEEELYLDITKKTERKRLLGVSYQIVCRKETAWPQAQEVLAYLRDDMKFDYAAIKWSTKSALMTIIYGIAQGREGIFDSWKHFTVRLMKYLGLDSIQEVGYPPRQRIATAAFYVTRGSEANKGNFAEAILDIELLFGVTKEDLREKEPLKLSEKLTIITAAQKVATTTDGNAKFRDAVREMSDIFDIEKERHHLEIPDKVRLITAVYETMTIKDGIKKFKDAVMGIDDIFNITEDELQRSLDIAEKIKVITAAYHIARAPDGMKIFEETIKKIGEKFNITDAQMKGISADGSEGLALHDKIRLITAGYAVALSAHSKGLEVFSRAIIAIGDIFGISDNEMKGIASEGRESLVLSDRMRLITAGYQAAQSGGGVSQFRRTVKGIKDIFDISDDSLKRELKLSDKMSFITAAYHVNLAKNGLDRFNKMIARDLINQIPHMTLESKVGFITTYASRVRWSGVGAEEMVSAGLIGKYMPVTDIEFIETDPGTHKGIIRFKAYHIDDPQKSEVEITINAGRAPPGMFNEYLTTGISEIDEKLLVTLTTKILPENRFILEPNQYGIDGIGAREILAVAKPFINNGIALYHEVCHAAIDKEMRQTLDGSSALLEEIIRRLTYKRKRGKNALDIYLEEKADKYKVPEDKKAEWKNAWRVHYALRLFQKKVWPEEDRQLSGKIKKQRNISEWIETELVESKRSYVLDEDHIHERFGLFIEVFFELEEKLHIDVTLRKQRKRLLNVCYEIVKAKATAWDIAQEVMKFLQDDMGFDYESLKWGTKSKLMTIIYGIGRASEGTFDYWKGFLERIQNRFGIKSYKGIENIERQKIATAAWYISRGRKAKEDRFDEAIDIIKRTFGISESEIKRDEAEGGLGLHEKIRFITAAYAVTLAKDGINEFEQIIIEIGDIVGMSPEDLRKKEAEGGLALSDKIKLISAAYHVAQSVGGLSEFKKSIGKIGKIFGITSAEMKKKEEEGGLTFADKVSLLMSGYRIAMHKNGLSVFTKATDGISNIFGITPDEMSKKKEDGGLALSDKIRLIIAASNVVRGKDGIETFKATIAKISDIFGITPGEMERKEEEGGLALYDKLRLITAAYQVAVKDSLSIFEQAIYRIGGIFGISPEEMRKKEDEGGLALPDKVSIITAAYAISQSEDGLELFDRTIEKIRNTFGITKNELKMKEEEGGIAFQDKISLLSAAYHITLRDGLNAFEKAIEKFQDIFGITKKEIRNKEEKGGLAFSDKVSLITAAYTIAQYPNGLKIFERSIDKIGETFGISEHEMKSKKAGGGLAIKAKLGLITAGYDVATSRGGLKRFEGAIVKISDTFGIAVNEMKNKESEGGLAFRDKMHLLRGACLMARNADGPKEFDAAIETIVKTFGISLEGLENKEEEGGLTFQDKIRFMTAACSISGSKDGLVLFGKVIRKISDIFGITKEEMKRGKEHGGLDLSDKIRLMTAGHQVASRNRLKEFEEIIYEIAKIFGFEPEDMKRKESQGGLAIQEKIHIITAAYAVTQHRRGVELFERSMNKITGIFGIKEDDLKKKERDGGLALSHKSQLMTAAYRLSTRGQELKIFEKTIDRIKDIFGITAAELKNEEEEGGLSIDNKISLITAAYNVAVKDRLDVFEDSIRKIGEVFGISKDKMKKKEEIGGLAFKYKANIITAAYAIAAMADNGLSLFERTAGVIVDNCAISLEDMKGEGLISMEDKFRLIKAIFEIVTSKDGVEIFEKKISSYPPEELSEMSISKRIGQIASIAVQISWGKMTLSNVLPGSEVTPDHTETNAIKAVKELVTTLFNLALDLDADEKVLIALDEDLGREGTIGLVKRVLKEIGEISEKKELKEIFRNIVIIKGRGKSLADDVLQYVGTGKDGIKVEKSNVIMVTRSANKDNCTAFEDEAIITFVDDSRLDIMDYYPVVEMALFSIAKALYHRGLTAYDKDKLASLYRSCHGEELDVEKIISDCVEKRVFTIVLEPIKSFEYEELRDIYESLQEFLRAA